MFVVAFVLFTWMVVIFWRLAWLQIARHEEFKAHAYANQHKEVAVKAPRGDIVDRQGQTLAMSVLYESLYADPRMLRAPEKQAERNKTAQVLAPALGLSAEELLRQLSSTKSFVWLRRQLPFDQADNVRQLIRQHKLSAVTLTKEAQRAYPNAQLAAHVIGSISGDERGLEGLERVLDSKLRGTDGKVELEQNALGQAWSRLDTAATSGAQVITTIDSVLQHKVEIVLSQVHASTKARSVTAIVLDPNNGEVLALANTPAFDPNERPKALNEARRNRAITDAYEPGSVFKLVAYAAALQEGLTQPTDLINCQGGTITLGRHTFHDSHLGLGTVTVAEAFAKSSNVGAIKTAQKLGEERFYQWIRKFGFNQRTGLELPGEVTGFLRPTKNWHNDSLGSLAIGQEISVTALQTVAAYAAVANRGVWVTPHLVKQVRSADGRPLYEPKIERRQLLDENVARQMSEMMQFVVNEGTGRAAAKLAGYTAAGKTGTPEKFVPGIGYKAGKFTPTFVGFVPATQPRFAIIVLIDEPQGLHQGGQVAAPAFNLIAEAALTDYLVMPDDQHFRTALAALMEKAQTKDAEQAAKAAEQAAKTAAKEAALAQRQAKSQPGAAVSGNPAGNPVAQNSNGRAAQLPPNQSRDVALNSRLTPGKPTNATNNVAAEQAVMPDLRGLSLRAVAQLCGKLSLRPKLTGSGQAVRQAPAAGTKIKPGSVCQVEFH